ncbi:Hypothetical predicted protein [Olea europaea subsp. europaea]|uniref:Uncharacterized protein n=1 Tax=Olea europaea subsp. europaea TaxID=158383 RepID=A0A8S0SX11_OLEEU|nr:Hypothetical predicted protein [Olea europaea subsp. europaea]
MAKEAQRAASPVRITEALCMEFELESSSATGPCAISGSKLVGAGLGSLLLDGNIPGASDGVAELEGTLEDAGLVADAGEVAGVEGNGDETGGDTAGVLTGVGVSVVGGDAGDGTGTEMPADGEKADGVGDCNGDADGLVFGELTGTAGETFEGGESTGDFAGDA